MNWNELIHWIIFVEIFSLIVCETIFMFHSRSIGVRNLIMCAFGCMFGVGDFVFEDYKITPSLFFFVLLSTLLLISPKKIKGKPEYLWMLSVSLVLLGVKVLFYKNEWVTIFACTVLLEYLIYFICSMVRNSKKEKNTRISIESMSERKIYLKFLKHLTSNKAYLNPDLNLDMIANEICTNRTYLSNAINNCSKSNFSTIVNRYRIEYAMDYMKKHPSASTDTVAAQSGFRTSSNLFYAFKKITGKSPKYWFRNDR